MQYAVFHRRREVVNVHSHLYSHSFCLHLAEGILVGLVLKRSFNDRDCPDQQSILGLDEDAVEVL